MQLAGAISNLWILRKKGLGSYGGGQNEEEEETIPQGIEEIKFLKMSDYLRW